MRTRTAPVPASEAAADALIHFGGEWPEAERERLTARIVGTERRAGAPPRPRHGGKLWVCHRQPYGRTKAVYSAGRLGRTHVFVAPTLDALLATLSSRA